MLLPGSGVPFNEKVDVDVLLKSVWPPMPRAQTPPPNWSVSGLGGLPIKAVDWLRKAELAASIAETRELIDPPEANGTKAVAGKAIPPMASGATDEVQGVCAATGVASTAAMAKPPRIAPMRAALTNRRFCGGADLAPKSCFIIISPPKTVVVIPVVLASKPARFGKLTRGDLKVCVTLATAPGEIRADCGERAPRNGPDSLEGFHFNSLFGLLHQSDSSHMFWMLMGFLAECRRKLEQFAVKIPEAIRFVISLSPEPPN